MEEGKNKSLAAMRGLIFLFAVAGIFSLALFIPQFRDKIILLAEFCLGRQLTGSVWHERMFNWEVYFLFFDLFICFIIYFSFLRFNKLAFSKGASWAAKILFFAALFFCQPIVCVSLKIKLIFCAIPVLEMLAFLCFVSYDEKERIQKHILSPISNVWRALATKRTLCFFAFFALFLFFCFFAILTVYETNSPIDTERLFLTGLGDGFLGQHRYFSFLTLTLFHSSVLFYNAVPLMRMIGILELSLCGIALSYVFTKRVSALSLLAALPAVLSPWFLHNMSYVYDPAFHPLSMLFGILPFLFSESIGAFVAASVVCNYLMCLTYQLSSGIYVIMALQFALIQYLIYKRELKSVAKFLGLAAVSYFIPLAFYEFGVFYIMPWNDYANGTLPPLAKIPFCVLANAKTYFQRLYCDLGNSALRYLYVAILLGGIISVALRSKRNKFAAFAITFFVSALSLALSFGIPLAFEKPLWLSRTFIGIGVFMSMQAFSLIQFPNERIAKRAAPVLLGVCAYYLTLFAYAYGAALYQQKIYVEARVNPLVADLNALNANPSEIELQIDGDIGLAPAALFSARKYPMLTKMMYSRAEGGAFVFLLAQRGVGKPMLFTDFEKYDLRLVVERSFYIIYGDGKHYRILLK